MDIVLLAGFALSVLSAVGRWKSAPRLKPLAAAGMMVGVGMLAWAAFPEVPAAAAAISIAVSAFIVGGFDWMLRRSAAGGDE